MYKQRTSLMSGKDEDSRTADYWTKQWSAFSLEGKLKHFESSPLWRLVASHVDSAKPVMEGGCGLGQWVAFLQQTGHDIVGVDIALPALKSAKRSHPDIRLLQCDVRALPFRSSFFGTYMSYGVIEHFEDGSGPVLREARRLLRGDGVLVITVPLHTTLTRLAAMRREKREGRNHFFQYLFSRREFRSLLEAHGFEVTEMHTLDTVSTMQQLFLRVYSYSEMPWRGTRGLLRFIVLACKLARRVLDKMPSRLCGHTQLAIAQPLKDSAVEDSA